MSEADRVNALAHVQARAGYGYGGPRIHDSDIRFGVVGLGVRGVLGALGGAFLRCGCKRRGANAAQGRAKAARFSRLLHAALRPPHLSPQLSPHSPHSLPTSYPPTPYPGGSLRVRALQRHRRVLRRHREAVARQEQVPGAPPIIDSNTAACRVLDRRCRARFASLLILLCRSALGTRSSPGKRPPFSPVQTSIEHTPCAIEQLSNSPRRSCRSTSTSTASPSSSPGGATAKWR